MTSAEVSKPSKWLSSSSSSPSSSSKFKTKNLKLSSISSRLKRSFSSLSSSPSRTPRNTVSTPPLSPGVSHQDHVLSAKAKKSPNSNKEERYKEVFCYFDGDGDGKISSLELWSYFASIGECLSHDEVQSVINDIDSDGDGLLSFQDFMVLMMKQPSSPSSNGSTSSSSAAVTNDGVEDLKLAFEMYEAEKGCGCITPKSLQRMLNRLGEDKSYEQCVSMIQYFDLDKNGTLDFHEFHQMMV